MGLKLPETYAEDREEVREVSSVLCDAPVVPVYIFHRV